MKKIVLILLATIILLSFNSCARKENYWPETEWQTSTPEEQGMDSEKLSKMLKVLKNYNINSVTIKRNGHMVLDVNLHPYEKNTRHAMMNVFFILIASICHSERSRGIPCL